MILPLTLLLTSAVDPDFQYWQTLKFNSKLSENYTLKIENEARWTSDIDKLSRLSIQVGLEKRLTPILFGSIDWRYAVDRRTADEWKLQGRFGGNLHLKLGTGFMKLRTRHRLEIATEPEDAKRENFRNRFHVYIGPIMLEEEIFINRDGYARNRIGAGLVMSLGSNFNLIPSYRWQHRVDGTEEHLFNSVVSTSF